MGFKDKAKQAEANRIYKKRIRERKSATNAFGGDQHHSVDIAKPQRKAEAIRRELKEHLQRRPNNMDIPAITEWVIRRDQLVFDLVRWTA